MKKYIATLFLFFSLSNFYGQDAEKFGNTLNVGVGSGYGAYYYGYGFPLMLNYEIDVAKNFTLAPFVGFYTYHNNYYWGDPKHGYAYYNYRYTAIPIGVKGTYYFDELLKAGDKWDFYGALSLGYIAVSTTWDNGYAGDPYYYGRPSPLYLSLHIGTEYHFTEKIGMFLDLSSAYSSIGLSAHF